jgi:hypothetical protein
MSDKDRFQQRAELEGVFEDLLKEKLNEEERPNTIEEEFIKERGRVSKQEKPTGKSSSEWI